MITCTCMLLLTRRGLLRTGLLGLGTWGFNRTAHASLFRGLSLEAISQSSDRIVVGRALDANAHWEVIGGRKRIVTDTRVRVEEVMAKSEPRDNELLVRTLGGTVGDVGAVVFGEAFLTGDAPCVLFLVEQADAVHRVRGMSQGHYPIRADTQRVFRLNPSPRAAEVLGDTRLATRRLIGQNVPQARRLIRDVLGQ